MENIKIDLFIDQPATKDPDLSKWISFVEKYLVYGLRQKGMEVNVVNEFNSNTDTVSVYLPVFTKAILGTEIYKQKIQATYELKEPAEILKLGLIKESVAIDTVEEAFPELKFSRMYLLDIDNGLEISDKDLWKKENFNFFLFKIFDLCNEIERTLGVLQKSQPVITSTKKAVYLAESSPDLIAVREGIRRELLRQGYDVYPEKAISGTPKEMEKAVIEFLQKSALSIHLIGKLYQEVKTNIAGLELENKVAANYFLTKKDSKKYTHNFKRIIWMPDNLVVTNEIQSKVLDQILKDKKLYGGAEIIKSSVEELKDIILEKLEEEDKNNGGTSGSGEGEGTEIKNVYIVTSEKNREEGESVKEILTTLGYQALINDGPKSVELGNIKKCDSVLFYYHNESPSWLKSKMGEVDKYKNWEYSSTLVKKGVITMENQQLPSDDIFKEIIHIQAQQKLEQEALLSFLHKAF